MIDFYSSYKKSSKQKIQEIQNIHKKMSLQDSMIDNKHTILI